MEYQKKDYERTRMGGRVAQSPIQIKNLYTGKTTVLLLALLLDAMIP